MPVPNVEGHIYYVLIVAQLQKYIILHGLDLDANVVVEWLISHYGKLKRNGTDI